MCIGVHACIYACARDGCVYGWADVCIRVRVYVYKYIHIYESEQGASKDREPAGGEEEMERESRLIRETRMSKGRNCQPRCETDNRLSSSGGRKADGGIGNLANDRQ